MLRVIFMVYIMIIINICVGKMCAYALLTIWNKWLLYNKAAPSEEN